MAVPKRDRGEGRSLSDTAHLLHKFHHGSLKRFICSRKALKKQHSPVAKRDRSRICQSNRKHSDGIAEHHIQRGGRLPTRTRSIVLLQFQSIPLKSDTIELLQNEELVHTCLHLTCRPFHPVLLRE